MKNYSTEHIIAAADELNAWTCGKLGYCAPEELFNAFPDRIYAVDSNSADLSV